MIFTSLTISDNAILARGGDSVLLLGTSLNTASTVKKLEFLGSIYTYTAKFQAIYTEEYLKI